MVLEFKNGLMCVKEEICKNNNLKYWLDCARKGSRSTWGFFCLKEKSSCKPTWNLDFKAWQVRSSDFKAKTFNRPPW